MISELVSRPETDILSALEEKCCESSLVEKFDEDPRVENALLCLLQEGLDLSQGWAGAARRLEYFDDQWVASYLLWRTGRYDMCLGLREGILSLYDPFRSSNPIVKVLAYCECIEESLSVGELDRNLESMRHYLGNTLECGAGYVVDGIVQRCYHVLEDIAEKRRRDIVSFGQFSDADDDADNACAEGSVSGEVGSDGKAA